MTCDIAVPTILEGINPNLEFGPWIAGGSVRSWVLKEPLNIHSDIDVFFKSQAQFDETKERLKPYCCHDVFNQKLNVHTLHVNVLHVDTGVVSKPYDIVNEVDFYNNLLLMRSFTEKQIKIQLVGKKFHPTHTAVIDNFDFSICQFITDGKIVVSGKTSYRDLDQRLLRVVNVKDVAMYRYVKYRLKGYRDNDETLSKILSESKVEIDASE